MKFKQLGLFGTLEVARQGRMVTLGEKGNPLHTYTYLEARQTDLNGTLTPMPAIHRACLRPHGWTDLCELGGRW